MRRAVGILLVVFLLAPVLHAQQALGIARVLLYKNGMAYIVRTGEIAGPMTLTFHPEDMNDVLKSFSAWNPDTGALYSVGYTAGIPSSHMLSRFPFDITSPETGLGSFLLQVKGAELKLDHSGRTLEGKLVAVHGTERVSAPQTSSADYRLTILTRDASLQSLWLSDVRSVEFVDPQLREQLRGYLDVLASGRQDVTREISIYPGTASGRIQVAYLQQFPLWKTSYRVDLGAKESRIQGWAQIDNPTGEAWENVTVSLLSGAPVSFQMNLYDPLYTTRSTVPVPGGLVAAPRRYESAVTSEAPAPPPAAAPAAAQRVDVQNARQQQPLQSSTPGGVGRNLAGGVPGGVPGGVVRESVTVTAPADAAFQEATATQVVDFYEYTFPFAVRLASRQSALLPFLQKTMTVERLSIFNARSDRGNPRLGARLENTTDIPFESGPVTFFQDARYAGEAVLDYLPRGEKALVSFGVDYDIQVSNRNRVQPETTVRLTVNRGVATLFHETMGTTIYELRNKGTDPKSLIIEHPRVGNRTLQGITPFETTDGFFRFRVSLAPGQATTLEVPEVFARQTTVSLGTLSRPQLTLFTAKATPPQVRQRLEAIVTVQEQIAAFQAEQGALQGRLDAMFRDQERLRENLKALGTGAEDQQLRSRYLGQLRKQEDESDAARAQLTTLATQLADAQVRLGDLVTTFTFN